ncbi:MAG: peptide chain release factor-like protein [Candidatus Aureabacteria bacterium]|nr:peptide chain release factor-like protein [Candidatus Auribacterota bacterium]
MTFFKISPKKEEKLINMMNELDVKEKDLAENFVKGHGKGGQKINKSSTCVILKHLPTGITVKCQKERSLSLNRFLARRLLLEKIEDLKKGKLSKINKSQEKVRKQKKKRKKRSKQKYKTSPMNM